MITGPQLRAARTRRRWTQEQLAESLGVTLRSVGNWERSKVPAGQEARIRDLMGGDLDEGSEDNPLAAASNFALAQEFVRRLEAVDRWERGAADGRQPDYQKSEGPHTGPVITSTRAFIIESGQDPQPKPNPPADRRLPPESPPA